MNKLKIAIVNYINTRPFIYGLENSKHKDLFDIIECSPSDCAKYFFNRTVDVSLVPTGALIGEEYKILNDFGIASDGKVYSVCLLSDVDLHEIKKVYLDYQSRTSVLLVQVLLKYHWKHEVDFLEAYPGYENEIENHIAGVVIGDRAMKYKSLHKYVFDLGAEWKKFTSLPFVFAAWVGHDGIDENIMDAFNEAIQLGVDNRDQLLSIHPGFEFNAREYFYENIKYELGENYFKGMERFLEYAGEMVTHETNI